MDRRSFLRRAAQKTGQTLIRQADARATARAQHWLRPPYAIDELDFLLACTRCDACIEACPYHVVFALPARLGPQVAGTPALDLLNRGCHLCNDWPCVSACEPAALCRPETPVDRHPPAPPKLAQAYIVSARCLPYQGPDCGACGDSCPLPGALRWVDFKPVVDSALCSGCGLCREACVVEPKAIAIVALAATPETTRQNRRL